MDINGSMRLKLIMEVGLTVDIDKTEISNFPNIRKKHQM